MGVDRTVESVRALTRAIVILEAMMLITKSVGSLVESGRGQRLKKRSNGLR